MANTLATEKRPSPKILGMSRFKSKRPSHHRTDKVQRNLKRPLLLATGFSPFTFLHFFTPSRNESFTFM